MYKILSKNIYKYLFSLTILSVPLSSLASSDDAVSIANGFMDKINSAILFPLIALMMAIALLVFLYGAFEYVRGASNETAREQGKKHLFYGVIGFLVMLSAVAILSIAAATFGLDTEVRNSQPVGSFERAKNNEYSGVPSSGARRSGERRTGSLNVRNQIQYVDNDSLDSSATTQEDDELTEVNNTYQEPVDNDEQDIGITTQEDDEEFLQDTVSDPDNDFQYINQTTLEDQEVSYNKPFTLGITEVQYSQYKDEINSLGYSNYITKDSIMGYVSVDKDEIFKVGTLEQSYVSECEEIGGDSVLSIDSGTEQIIFYCIDDNFVMTYDQAKQRGLIQTESEGGFWSFLPWK